MADRVSLDDLRIEREDKEHGSRGRWVGLVLLFLLLAGLAAWWFLRPQIPIVEVSTARQMATGTAAGAVLDASGYVTARRRATVSSKITARVREVLVEEGMVVEEGQILARLDDATAQRQLALARAELSAAKGGLAETRVRLVEAGLELGRQERLVASGVSTPADLDGARAQVDALKARLEVEGLQVTVAERRLAVRRQDVEDTIIRAPFSGVAVTKDAQPGEMISPVTAGGGFTRTGICTLVDMDSLEIEVDVNEAYINRVESGMEVQATLDAYPDWKIPASVIITVPAADRQKATVRVRIGFEKLDPRMLPDMGIKVSFLDEAIRQEASTRRVVLVSEDAVRRDGERDIVLVVNGDVIERRAVQVGGQQGKSTEILAGVSSGERVVVAGPPELGTGDRVQILE